ncbi:MAG TPA: VOC family protein [Hydrogenophaga sp.]|nr:VOC family protein [Hydrogenophaga sp.]
MNEIHEVYPYLMVRDSSAAITFYQRAFGAVELFRLVEPSGRIGHAELQLGPIVLMVCDEFPEYGMVGPQGDQFTGCTIHLHVNNADEMGERAVAAGATMLMPPTDQFYGERSCRLRDPFGHAWLIGHSIEKLEPEEMQRRYTAMMTSAAN